MPARPPKDLSDTIISFVTDKQQKVAMVVGKVLHAYEARGISVNSTIVGARIAKLVKSGRLVGVGDVTNWRFSEVRFPVAKSCSGPRAKRQAPE